MIYDEESDRHVHITFEDALNATCYGHASGPKGDIFGLAKIDNELDPKLIATNKARVGTKEMIATNEMIAKAQADYDNATEGSEAEIAAKAVLDTAKRPLGKTALEWRDLVRKFPADPNKNELKPFNTADVVTAIKDAVKNGHWVPVEIVIARPFIEHLMLSAVVAVAGRDTGATLFGPAGTFVQHTLSLSLLLSLLQTKR